MHHRDEVSYMQVVNALLAAGTGTTDVTGVDCSQADHVRWLIPITTTLDTGSIKVTVQHADADTGYVDTVATVTKVDAGGSQYNGMILEISVAKPQKRWNRVEIIRSVANSALGPTICELYGAPADPTSLNTTKVASATRWNSPASA